MVDGICVPGLSLPVRAACLVLPWGQPGLYMGHHQECPRHGGHPDRSPPPHDHVLFPGQPLRSRNRLHCCGGAHLLANILQLEKTITLLGCATQMGFFIGLGSADCFLLASMSMIPPRWHQKESACQWRRHKRDGFHPSVGKIPWSREWQPTPVFLPGKFHRQRSLAVHGAAKSQTRLTTVTTLCLFHAFWIKSVCCRCCCVTSVVANSVWPHRRQPTRLPHPWDSPGQNTGVGCHFLLQCMKVKSESEVTQSCWLLATPWTAAYQAPPSMGFSRQEYWSGVPLTSPLDGV